MDSPSGGNGKKGWGMKISRTSWHYKVSNFSECENRNDNLCNYFWRLAFKLVVFTMVFALLVLFVTAVALGPELRLFLAVVLYCIASVLLPVFAVSKFREKMGTNSEVPGESILKEFIKAKKNKLCPIIKYVD